ncbi:MAG: ATP-dependent metallopeptidase FtsH/Yme1/Tma family protein [Candidatus Pacebacteria bacterium]|nr:ATP-dependent metallopeptidase FtsH/Yme1/Tma family protein [Candidatus Paceibacterota bacterium]
MLKGEKLKYFALFFSLVLFFLIFFIGEKKLKEEQEISFVNFLDKVKKGEVKEINIESDSNIIFLTKDGKIFRTSKDPNSSLWEVFEKEKIHKNDYLNIKINKKPEFSFVQLLLSFILNVLPVAIIIWFIWQMFKQTQKGTSQIFSFGKSGIKVYNPDDPNKVTFKDIADLEEAKQELMEVVEFLKNPDKFLKIGAKIPKGVLLVGPPGSGKCVVGDTLVFTNKGIMEIQEIPKYFYVDKFTNKVEGAYLPTLDLENLEKVQDRAIYFYELPETETIKITTKQGFELEGTPEHPIVVLDNDGKLIFKTLQDVDEGDIVAIKFNTQIFGNLEEVTEEEAYIMGILTGDENLSAGSRLELTTADKELAEIFVNYFKVNYPQYSVFTRPQYTRNRNKSIVYGISSWPAKKRFFEKGMSCFISYDKYVPTSIMMGSKKIVVSFLRGLFDSDGYVEKNRGGVGLSSVSKKLIYQVAMLLLNLGIVPSIRVKHRVDGRHLRDVYSLTISGTHLLKFAKEIGFALPRKQKELENYLYTRWKGNTNVDVFYNIGEIVNTACKEISQKRLSNSWLAYITDKTRDRNRISRNTLIRFIEELESKNATSDEFYYLKKLLEADLYFVPIVKKEYSKNKVYDFTVEKSHSFISNGFISHNTLLARATAAEAGVPFFYISGSEFVEMFVGVGASVTGDTPVLIKENNKIKLLPIKKVVDKYYKENEEGIIKFTDNLETLGFESKGRYFFKKPKWTKVRGVFRHKVDKIYEIYFRGGKIKTTGDHSIFVREKNKIVCKRAEELRIGDVLVNLPFKRRSLFIKGLGTTHKVSELDFNDKEVYLDLYEKEFQKTNFTYNFALSMRNVLSQKAIGKIIGFAQTTIKDWQIGRKKPRLLSSFNLLKFGVPTKIKVTEDLMRLMGYYTAEGRTTKYFTQFIFGIHEKELIEDCVNLIEKIFNIKPHIKEYEDTNSIRITIHSSIISKFFKKHCGNSAKKKHIPSFLWELPFNYYKAYLEGLYKGDGFISKDGRLIISTVSKRLALEIIWLSALHGYSASLNKKISPKRKIRDKVINESKYYIVKFGKTSNPFLELNKTKQPKKPIVTKILIKPYNDYVYDLCGCENEAFFGGEKPILLHNSRVRDAFAIAKRNQPSILFIDEIDAIGKVRGVGITGGHEEREQTLNQILVEMDGFEKGTRVVVIGATNRPDVLDPALLRPGRFDRKIVLDLPDVKAREEILKIHLRDKRVGKVNLKQIAELTPGFSGADLANLCNEAAILAARRNKEFIEQEDLLDAIDKVLLGPERKTKVYSKKEKEIAAYHEAGHALVAHYLPFASPVQKISIIARGRAGGYTLKTPLEERSFYFKKEFLDELASMLGGYAAEKLVYNDITTGASNDLEIATDLARQLVLKFGMSEKLGPISFSRTPREFYLEKEYSEKTAEIIDEEVKKIIDKALERALKVLTLKKDKLEKVAKVLMKEEVIEKRRFERLVGEKKGSINVN